MPSYKRSPKFWPLLCVTALCCALTLRGEEPAAPAATAAAPATASTAPPAAAQAATSAPTKAPDVAQNDDVVKNEVDFQSEDTFIDVPDALRSKQFVQRAILSSTIRETSHFGFARTFITQTLGYDAIFQPANRGPFAKYDSGDLTLSGGYISEGGSAYELGLSLSAVSNLFVDYKYIFRPKALTFWPFLGAGLGENIGDLNITTPPPAAAAYLGGSTMFFATVGLLVPLVDVGLRAEAKFEFYGLNRLVLATGIGVNFFL